jgi:prepilin-type N-terminal cleavage/methylation domain-containing protein
MLNNTFNIKKNIQFYLQATKTRQSSHHANEGFTLIELLIATSIMGIVATLAGFGVVAMLQQNKTAASETDRRTNLNRALDFIANEVRSANSLASTSSSLPSDATGVLRLTIPSDTAFPTHEYYIKPVNTNCATTSPSTNVLWATPNMICRRLIPTSGSPSDSMLVDGVTSAVFGFTGRQVDLTLTGKTTSGNISVNTTAVTRAKL